MIVTINHKYNKDGATTYDTYNKDREQLLIVEEFHSFSHSPNLALLELLALAGLMEL